MTAGIHKKTEKSPSHDELFHNRNLLLAISRVGQSIQRAQTVEEVYRAVGDQIKLLGGETTLLMVNENSETLSVTYTSYSPDLIRKAEKITGLSLREYRIPFSSTSIYGSAMEGGKTIFSLSTGQTIAEILPKPFHLFIPPLISMFNLRQGVLSPLQVDTDILGLLKVNGDFLSEDDLPAMDSFAGQIAAGLRNVQLRQELQNELSARKQAEESLRYSRNLLMALSRAAQSVLSASTAEDIYQAVGEQIKSLGYDVVILTVSDENQYLNHTYSTFSKGLIETGEKLTGLSLQNYRFLVPLQSIYGRILATGKGDLLQLTTDTIAEALPKPLRSMSATLASLLKIQQGVIAPLCVDGKAFGVLTVVGASVTEDDIPAMDSFAGQVAVSLNNVRLKQQAQQELSERKQAEKRFKALIENAPDGIALVGLDGKAHYVSPSARNMFGHGYDDVVTNGPLELIHPDDLATVLNAINDLVGDPAYVPTLEYRYKHKDNTYHWVESIFSNLLSEPGVQSIVINFRDVTERKLVEEALKQSEAHYRLLADHTTDTIWQADMNLKTTYVSPCLEDVRGYTLEQLQELPLDQNLAPASLQLVMNLFLTELPKVQSDPMYSPVFTLELDFLNRDGTIYSTETKLSLIRDDEGNPVSILGESRDIAERKRVEAALHESEARWQFALEGAGDGVWDWDVPSGQVFYSQQWKSMLGYAEHEVINILGEWEKRVHPYDKPKCRQALARHLANETPIYQNEHRILCKDGTYKWILDRGKVITRDENGNARRVIGTHTDITERKQAEESLRASEEKSKSLYQMLRLMTDNLPVLVWAKDMEGRFIFVNKAFAEKLLIAQDTEEPIGKTDLYFAMRQRAEHSEIPNWHTFGELCINSDKVVHASQQAQRFDEFGNVKGTFLFLDVYKAPFWDEQGRMIGTVGVARDVTLEKKMEEERLRTQEALAASEAELRALFSSMRDTVLVIDQNGVYRNIAETHPNRLYIPPKEVIGKKLSDFFSTVQTQKFLDLIRWVLKTQKTGQVEYQIFINDQAPWFEASISPMGVDATLWVARDITERKKIESALVQSENAYRTLFENMPIGLYRTSADGQILDANPALVKMFGYPDKVSLLRKNAGQLYVDHATNIKFKEEILKSGTLSAFEAEFYRYDQSTFWAEDYGRTVCDEAGVPLYYEGSLINVTERKKAAYELRLANTLLESAHQELQQMFVNEQVLARTDGLSGLYNRRYFFELAIREFNASARYQHPLTIILFDVDDFKRVNDVFGHAFGDDVLFRVSQTTAVQVRDVDVLARYGGDEFIILLPQTNARQAFLIAERIRQNVASTKIEVDGSAFAVTLSIGVAEMDHSLRDHSVEDVIRRADKALYTAKQKGRNNTVIFEER